MNKEKTIILLPRLPGVDELCAALMIACEDKANTIIYTGQKSYPKIYHEFLQPDGVKFLAEQDINKQIELSLKLSPPDSTVKNIRWDSDQSELKIFVELEDTNKSRSQNRGEKSQGVGNQGIESLEASTITARQVGFDHILSFASTAEEIEDYPLLRDSGRLFGGKLIKLVADNPVNASYNYLLGKTADNTTALNPESSRFYEIGQKYHNSYRSAGSGFYTSNKGQLYQTTSKQIRILLDFWSGNLKLDEEEQIWELFGLIMLTPSLNPLIQQGTGSVRGIASAGSLELQATKLTDNQSKGKIVLQRDYHEYSLAIYEVGTETVKIKQTDPAAQPAGQKSTLVMRTQNRQATQPLGTKAAIASTKSIATKKTDYIPLAPAVKDD